MFSSWSSVWSISNLITWLQYIIVSDICIRLRYLYKTKHLERKFDVSKNKELTKNQQNSANNKHVFETLVDALFVNKNNCRSIKNYIFKLFDNLIDWTTKKQTTISTFTIEIELLTMLHIDKKFIWWINLFKKLEFSSNH